MNVLITGGAGYIGSVLCGELLESGVQSVTVVDNFRHGVPSLNAHLARYPNLHIVRGDARDSRVLAPLVEKADVVMPLAALVGVPECQKDIFAAESTNLTAIKMLCELNPKHVIFPNTNSGYGLGGEDICSESCALRPISLYGQTKCAAEMVLLERVPRCTVFRLATVFGMSSRMRWDLMVNNFVYRAVKDHVLVLFQPHFRRNFVHVLDVAWAFQWAMDKKPVGVFNLGLDEANLTKQQLAEIVQQFVPGFSYCVSEHCEDPDKRNYFVSNAKLKEAGFTPSLGLNRGIQELTKGAMQYD